MPSLRRRATACQTEIPHAVWGEPRTGVRILIDVTNGAASAAWGRSQRCTDTWGALSNLLRTPRPRDTDPARRIDDGAGVLAVFCVDEPRIVAVRLQAAVPWLP